MKTVSGISVLSLILGAFFFVACTHVPSHKEVGTRAPASAVVAYDGSIRGLEGIDLDRWTAGFFVQPTSRAAGGLKDIARVTTQSYASSRNISSFYSQLLSQNWNRGRLGSQDLQVLAEGLYAARKSIRQLPDAGVSGAQAEYRRKAVQLLSFMADEALYSHEFLYPGKLPYFKRNFLQAPQGLPNVDLNGIKLISGDVLLSKGGAGSSAFIARVVDHPGNFSHSVTAAIDPATNSMGFIEAEIEDGVKFRNPLKDYVVAPGKNGKRRLFVFRYAPQGKKDLVPFYKKAASGVEAVLADMHKRVRDIGTEASFPYDFDFNPKQADKLFCSEVSYYVYQRAGFPEAENPYAPRYWSSAQGINEKFFRSFLNIPNIHFPAPADIELNPKWDVAGYQIYLPTIGLDRTDLAMMDDVFGLMTESEESLGRVFDSMEDLGNFVVTPELLKKARGAGLITEEQLKVALKSLPENIQFKQFIFFAFMDEKLTPMVRATVAQLEKDIAAKYRRPLGLIELRKALLSTIRAQTKAFADRLPAMLKAIR